MSSVSPQDALRRMPYGRPALAAFQSLGDKLVIDEFFSPAQRSRQEGKDLDIALTGAKTAGQAMKIQTMPSGYLLVLLACRCRPATKWHLTKELKSEYYAASNVNKRLFF